MGYVSFLILQSNGIWREKGQAIGETRPDHQRNKTEYTTNQTKTLSIE